MKKLSDIEKIAVIGAGVMGPGIVQAYACGGYKVTLIDIFPEALEKGKAALKNGLEVFQKEGVISAEEAASALARISYSTSVVEGVQGADLVTECVVEKRAVKESVYAQLDEVLPADTVIASNTSAMNIFEFMPRRRMANTLITHWYAPAQLVPLVEVVKSDEAPRELAVMVVELLERCGKSAVLMDKFIQGYIVNRLQACLTREVFHLLDHDICTPEDIDKAVKTSFIPRAMVVGLCQRMDFSGLDMTGNNFRNHSYSFPPDTDMPVSLAKHLEQGELGVKSGKGFYDYSKMDMSQVLAKRDRQLLEVYRLQRKLMSDPLVSVTDKSKGREI